MSKTKNKIASTVEEIMATENNIVVTVNVSDILKTVVPILKQIGSRFVTEMEQIDGTFKDVNDATVSEMTIKQAIDMISSINYFKLCRY